MASKVKRTLAGVCVAALAGYLALANGLLSPTFYLGGIQVNEPDHEAWMAALQDEGMNTVAVTVYAKQGDWDSANLWFEEEEPWVVEEMRMAKRHGLKVVLILRVALDHAFPRNAFYWHGMIHPRTDDLLEEWFRRYTRFASQWAEIAQNEGVDVLGIASEMNSLTNTLPVDEIPALEEYWSNPEKVEREQQKLLEQGGARTGVTIRGETVDSLAGYLDAEEQAHRAWAHTVAYLSDPDPVAQVNARRARLESLWRSVIGAARERYDGSLTYAANFDQYHEVGFWRDLDLIGINAYFPLRRRLVETDAHSVAPLLRARWRTILQEVDRFRVRHASPEQRVLFTELGYVRRANSTIQPWASDGMSIIPSDEGETLVVWSEQPEDRAERASALRALYEANLDLGGQLLAGILYWKLTTVPSHEAIEPFALVVGPDAPADPLRDELRPFLQQLPVDRWRWRLGFSP